MCYRFRMGTTFAIAGQKGGIGKSTLAINLASFAMRAEHRVLLVDADQQGTCVRWARRAGEEENEAPTVIAIDGKDLARNLRGAGRGFDVVIIDCPGKADGAMASSMVNADVVILPIIPGGPDVWALEKTLAILEQARGLRPELQAVIVRNRANPRAILSRLVQEAVAEVEGVQVLAASIGHREAIGQATTMGQSIFTFAPGSDAAAEMTRVVRGVFALAEMAAPSEVMA